MSSKVKLIVMLKIFFCFCLIFGCQATLISHCDQAVSNTSFMVKCYGDLILKHGEFVTWKIAHEIIGKCLHPCSSCEIVNCYNMALTEDLYKFELCAEKCFSFIIKQPKIPADLEEYYICVNTNTTNRDILVDCRNLASYFTTTPTSTDFLSTFTENTTLTNFFSSKIPNSFDEQSLTSSLRNYSLEAGVITVTSPQNDTFYKPVYTPFTQMKQTSTHSGHLSTVSKTFKKSNDGMFAFISFSVGIALFLSFGLCIYLIGRKIYKHSKRREHRNINTAGTTHGEMTATFSQSLQFIHRAGSLQLVSNSTEGNTNLSSFDLLQVRHPRPMLPEPTMSSGCEEGRNTDILQMESMLSSKKDFKRVIAHPNWPESDNVGDGLEPEYAYCSVDELERKRGSVAENDNFYHVGEFPPSSSTLPSINRYSQEPDSISSGHFPDTPVEQTNPSHNNSFGILLEEQRIAEAIYAKPDKSTYLQRHESQNENFFNYGRLQGEQCLPRDDLGCFPNATMLCNIEHTN